MSNSPLQFSVKSLLILIVAGAIFGFLMMKYGVILVFPWAMLFLLCVVCFMLAKWIAINAKIAAENDPTSPRKLETFNDNLQASILVSRLDENGIHATAVGGFTSGFQAESPGYVDVVVRRADYDDAKKLLDSWRSELDSVEEQ